MLKQEYHVIGLMSGTSLDGLDVALCRLAYDDNNWSYKILESTTFDYNTEWKSRLISAHNQSANELALLNVELGILHGNIVKQFVQNNSLKVDFIASHGHTVFHQPHSSFTTQIGSAPHIAVIVGLPVIADFRTTDVALGGQGAPLVPIGDLHLFKEYDCCLNLGGVANISVKAGESIRAFDICICNMALNFLANKLGMEYDANGAIAASGKLNEHLFEQLSALSFYTDTRPKSLGKEFFDTEILPLINSNAHPTEDVLHTFVEHIAFQIARSSMGANRMLVSGGGVFNSFLVERLKTLCEPQIVIPDHSTIQFKEALIFAFLGVLRMRGENNCLTSVTGASRDSVGGAIYLP